jgi:hypothetical protein
VANLTNFAVAMDDRNPAVIAVPPHDDRIVVVCVMRPPIVMVVNTDTYGAGADINTVCPGWRRRQCDGRRRQAADCNVPHLESPRFVSHA